MSVINEKDAINEVFRCLIKKKDQTTITYL